MPAIGEELPISAAEKPIIQGANETGFFVLCFIQLAMLKICVFLKWCQRHPAQTLLSRRHNRLLLMTASCCSLWHVKLVRQSWIRRLLASLSCLRLSDDLKPARLIDLNAFKSPQNWLEELSDPFISNTKLGYFNIPIGTEIPSMTLYPNSKFERTVYMSPEAFAEGVNEDVWRSAILTAESF